LHKEDLEIATDVLTKFTKAIAYTITREKFSSQEFYDRSRALNERQVDDMRRQYDDTSSLSANEATNLAQFKQGKKESVPKAKQDEWKTIPSQQREDDKEYFYVETKSQVRQQFAFKVRLSLNSYENENSLFLLSDPFLLAVKAAVNFSRMMGSFHLLSNSTKQDQCECCEECQMQLEYYYMSRVPRVVYPKEVGQPTQGGISGITRPAFGMCVFRALRGMGLAPLARCLKAYGSF